MFSCELFCDMTQGLSMQSEMFGIREKLEGTTKLCLKTWVKMGVRHLQQIPNEITIALIFEAGITIFGINFMINVHVHSKSPLVKSSYYY